MRTPRGRPRPVREGDRRALDACRRGATAGSGPWIARPRPDAARRSRASGSRSRCHRAPHAAKGGGQAEGGVRGEAGQGRAGGGGASPGHNRWRRSRLSTSHNPKNIAKNMKKSFYIINNMYVCTYLKTQLSQNIQIFYLSIVNSFTQRQR